MREARIDFGFVHPKHGNRDGRPVYTAHQIDRLHYGLKPA
jgi:hypothetical protein